MVGGSWCSHVVGACPRPGRVGRADRQDAGIDYRYCYDADGNITIRSTSSSAVDCATIGGKFTYNSANQWTGTGAPSYDADGNITASPSSSPALTALVYDGADRTTSITPAGGSAQTATYAGPDSTERRAFGSTSFEMGVLGVQSETTASTTRYFEQYPTGTGPFAVSYGSTHADHYSAR